MDLSTWMQWFMTSQVHRYHRHCDSSGQRCFDSCSAAVTFATALLVARPSVGKAGDCEPPDDLPRGRSPESRMSPSQLCESSSTRPSSWGFAWNHKRIKSGTELTCSFLSIHRTFTKAVKHPVLKCVESNEILAKNYICYWSLKPLYKILDLTNN